jgi:hypothetical protein
MQEGYSDYKWLNDDTILEPEEVFAIIKEILAHLEEGIRLRSVLGPLLKPFRYAMVAPRGHIESVDVFNGNLVWISHDVAANHIGNLDPSYEHAMGGY